jgi:hypothetical protein
MFNNHKELKSARDVYNSSWGPPGAGLWHAEGVLKCISYSHLFGSVTWDSSLSVPQWMWTRADLEWSFQVSSGSHPLWYRQRAISSYRTKQMRVWYAFQDSFRMPQTSTWRTSRWVVDISCWFKLIMIVKHV